jgi:hypothetical protein
VLDMSAASVTQLLDKYQHAVAAAEEKTTKELVQADRPVSIAR